MPIPATALEPGGDYRTKTRWLWVENASGLVVPSYAAMRVTGVTLDEGLPIITVSRPNADGLTNVLFNGPTSIGVSDRGVGHATFPGDALFESADGTPAAGDEWGTADGSWKLRVGKTGFLVVGVVADSVATVRQIRHASVSGEAILANIDDVSGTTPFKYGWVEQQIADDGTVADKEGGRTGTVSDGFALELENTEVDVGSLVVLYRASDDPEYYWFDVGIGAGVTGLSAEITYVSAVSCDGETLTVTTRVMTFTHGILVSDE